MIKKRKIFDKNNDLILIIKYITSFYIKWKVNLYYVLRICKPTI
jgi:hypothetical protein